MNIANSSQTTFDLKDFAKYKKKQIRCVKDIAEPRSILISKYFISAYRPLLLLLSSSLFVNSRKAKYFFLFDRCIFSVSDILQGLLT